MAAALAVMQEMEDKMLMYNCIKTGQYLNKKLQVLKDKHSLIGKWHLVTFWLLRVRIL